jgi:hypothetical protein
MPTVASGMASVHCVQSLVEVQLIEVGVWLGTKPFAKTLHCSVALLMHLLPAERAALVKEACEKMHQHAFTLPQQVPDAASHSTIVFALDVARRRSVSNLHFAKRVPTEIDRAGSTP